MPRHLPDGPPVTACEHGGDPRGGKHLAAQQFHDGSAAGALLQWSGIEARGRGMLDEKCLMDVGGRYRHLQCQLAEMNNRPRGRGRVDLVKQARTEQQQPIDYSGRHTGWKGAGYSGVGRWSVEMCFHPRGCCAPECGRQLYTLMGKYRGPVRCTVAGRAVRMKAEHGATWHTMANCLIPSGPAT